MLNLWSKIQESFRLKTKPTTDPENCRDISDPGQSLPVIACDLAHQLLRMESGEQMITAKLQDTLKTLSVEERSFIVNYYNPVYHVAPFTGACVDGLWKMVIYMCRTCSPDLNVLYEHLSPESERRMAPVLWHAVVADQLETVRALLNAGADVNAVSDNGSTSINSACFLERTEMVSFLLYAKADINIPNNKGGTCLMNSVKNATIFHMLLLHGADMYARDTCRKTVLHYAIESRSVDIVQYLLEGPNPFQIEAEDSYNLLIASAIADSDIFKILYKVPYIQDGRDFRPDALEIMGCKVFTDNSSACISEWILAARIRRSQNVTKSINEPIPLFEYRSECISEEQLLELKTFKHILYEVLMIYMRVLGPTHDHFIVALEDLFDEYYDEYTVEANRLGFLLLNTSVKKFGILDAFVCGISSDIMLHCFKLMQDEVSINYEILFEVLKVYRDGIEAVRPTIARATSLKKKHFDWTLNFLLVLLYLIRINATRKQTSIVRAYVKKFLLANGSDGGQLRTTSMGYTLLHLAVSRCNEVKGPDQKNLFPRWSIAQLLLTCSAPVNAVAFDGTTPLFLAVAFENYDEKIVELLLHHGADPGHVGPAGETALKVLQRCLDASNGALKPPKNMPNDSSLEPMHSDKNLLGTK